MGTCTSVCKFVCNRGEFYSLISNTSDQFIFPLFKSPKNFSLFLKQYYEDFYKDSDTLEDYEEIAKNICKVPKETINKAILLLAGKNLSADDFLKKSAIIEDYEKIAKNTTEIYTVTKKTIHKAVSLLEEMKRGKSLSKDEACELYNFWKFLDLTVGDPPHNHAKKSIKIVNRWIDELNIREDFIRKSAMEELSLLVKNKNLKLDKIPAIPKSINSKLGSTELLTVNESDQLKNLLNLSDITTECSEDSEWDWADILDHAKYTSFGAHYFNRLYPETHSEPEQRSTSEKCNKLAGRYVSSLAIIAKIVGPEKHTPEEIVEYFRYKEPIKNLYILKKKYKEKRVYTRPAILLGIYKQLIVSNKGRQTKGRYRNLSEKKSMKLLELIMWLIGELKNHHLYNHAIKLQNQYL